jgi:hypothetical protein
MAKGRRMTALGPMPVDQTRATPAWSRRLDRLFHRRNTLDGLMRSLSDPTEDPQACAIARSLIPVFLRTPWPQLEIPSAASDRLATLAPEKRERSLQRWKRAFYALVLQDDDERNGIPSPHPFHATMVQAGHPEYVHMLRQREVDRKLVELSRIREERLEHAAAEDEEAMDVFFRDHYYSRAMLHIERLESSHILKAIWKLSAMRAPDEVC